ncbi:alanine--glyoxylate transaminase [Pycnococcus provasolii]
MLRSLALKATTGSDGLARRISASVFQRMFSSSSSSSSSSSASSASAASASSSSTCDASFHKKPLPLDHNGGLYEYSVVYTDRALNHMSDPFGEITRDLNGILNTAYNSHRALMFPGSGTYSMEACARAFATDKKVLVLRNGYFSYRWTDIFEQTGIPSEVTVLKGQPQGSGPRPQFTPHNLEDVVATIKREKPAVVFAPHIETSTGIKLPDEYVAEVGAAVQEHGGHFVLDCIASGTYWVDMKAQNVDVVISAPQKGWTGPACVGLAMLSERATEVVRTMKPTSMVLNLSKWLDVAESYENGGFMYYATMPTDAIQLFRDVARETQQYGFDNAKTDFVKLGEEVREMMGSKGFTTVAADGYHAPGVVVAYTDDPNMFGKFKSKGYQIAAGVPFMIDEPKGNHTFRIGLFGLDKIKDRALTVSRLEKGFDDVLGMPVEATA